MWEGQVNSRHLLSRNHDRHVFLFEKVIIFTKKKEESSNQQKKENRGDAYFYKSHLHVSLYSATVVGVAVGRAKL